MAATGYADVVSVQPWELAEQYAGLSDPTLLTNYSGNDPNNPITLASGTYQNLTFICTQLIIPNNSTKLVNCDIICSNASFSVRLDANTGEETGRYLEHCRVTGAGVAFSGAGFRARLCEVYHNGDDSARVGRSHAEQTVFELCHFHDFKPVTNAHADGVQIQTVPAADVIVWGCSIAMNTASGYTMPSGAGYTGAIFMDSADVPVPGGDPEPTRVGNVWVDSCKLSSTNNYTLVIDGPNVDVSNCTLLPGTTAVESIMAGITVTGHHNVDPTGAPIVDTNIGAANQRFTMVDDPRVTLATLGDVDTSGATDGQVLSWDAAESQWEPATVSGGGGSGTLAGLTDVNVVGVTDGQVLEWVAAGSKWEPRTVSGGGGGSTVTTDSVYVTNGTINLPNTAGVWVEVTEGDNSTPMEIAIPAAVGNRAAIEFNAMRTGSNAIDIAVMVGSQIRRFLSTGTASPALDGDMGWYAQGGSFALHGGRRSFVVTSNDLDSGHVRFAMVTKGSGTGVIEASADDTFYWEATVIS